GGCAQQRVHLQHLRARLARLRVPAERSDVRRLELAREKSFQLTLPVAVRIHHECLTAINSFRSRRRLRNNMLFTTPSEHLSTDAISAPDRPSKYRSVTASRWRAFKLSRCLASRAPCSVASRVASGEGPLAATSLAWSNSC